MQHFKLKIILLYIILLCLITKSYAIDIDEFERESIRQFTLAQADVKAEDQLAAFQGLRKYWWDNREVLQGEEWLRRVGAIGLGICFHLLTANDMYWRDDATDLRKAFCIPFFQNIIKAEGRPDVIIDEITLYTPQSLIESIHERTSQIQPDLIMNFYNIFTKKDGDISWRKDGDGNFTYAANKFGRNIKLFFRTDFNRTAFSPWGDDGQQVISYAYPLMRPSPENLFHVVLRLPQKSGVQRRIRLEYANEPCAMGFNSSPCTIRARNANIDNTELACFTYWAWIALQNIEEIDLGNDKESNSRNQLSKYSLNTLLFYTKAKYFYLERNHLCETLRGLPTDPVYSEPFKKTVIALLEHFRNRKGSEIKLENISM